MSGVSSTSDHAFLERRRQIARWVAQEILPHERSLRGGLRRMGLSGEDIDDVVQECYCQIARLDQVDHILNPRAYFFGAARHLVARQRVRDRIVPIDAHSEMDMIEDLDVPAVDQIAGSRLDYARIRRLMASLPERCRKIVELRKIEGWSQKEIADQLGVTEKVVEKQVWQGVRALRKAWADEYRETASRIADFEAGEAH